MRRVLGPGLVLLMCLGALVMWVGIPFAWLWIGSQVQGATDSLSAAIGAMIFGVVASIALVASLLARLGEKHREVRLARGLDDLGNVPLEMVMVTSATIALAGFVIWFFLFSGSSPVPINISY